MQYKLILDRTRETSSIVLEKAKSEVTKMWMFVPNSFQSALAMASVSKNASLELKEISSLALAKSAQTAKAQQRETLSRLMQGSAQVLAATSLPNANRVVDQWIEEARAHREELMQTA